MRRRRVGPVGFQARFAGGIDAQAGQRKGSAPCWRPAFESCPRGFSLVELTIVIGIIMTLAAIAIPSFFQALAAARYAKAVGDITTMETDIVTYEASNGGALPNTLTDIGRSDLRDPWGNPYVYTNYAIAANKNLIRKDRFLHPMNSDYDLFSAGVDGQWKPPITDKVSHDDIIRASDGAYIGLASQF